MIKGEESTGGSEGERATAAPNANTVPRTRGIETQAASLKFRHEKACRLVMLLVTSHMHSLRF